MEYIKLDIPVKEKLIFLFTNLIRVKYLVDKWGSVNTTTGTEKAFIIESKSTPLQEKNNGINTKEEIKQDSPDFKMDIPFFDLDTSKTKSNL